MKPIYARASLAVMAVSILLRTGSFASGGLLGCISEIPPETPTQRQARHQMVAERRAGPVVIVHRGAHAFAPENTLEAFQAAMNYGADGVELDIRRSADGVLFCFHDSWLDRTTDGYGPVSPLSYRGLLSARLKKCGTATERTCIPTLAAVLTLARQRGMLLEVDVKDSGIEDDIAAILDAADAWDHVVNFSAWNADALRANPKFKMQKPTAYLPEGRRDMDPETIQAKLPKPGHYIVVDDPRLIVHELKRKPYAPMLLPEGLYTIWPAKDESKLSEPKQIGSPAYVDSLGVAPGSYGELLAVLRTDCGDRSDLGGSEEHQRERAARIWNRGWAAHELGEVGRKSAYLVYWLEYQVKHRSFHRNWYYDCADAYAAIRALVALGSVESVPMLIERFNTVDPNLDKLSRPGDQARPLSWHDGGIQYYIIRALGDLRTEQAKQFLVDYIGLDLKAAEKMGPSRYATAAAALLKYDLTAEEIERITRSPHSAVRGTAVQYCLDHPGPNTDAALDSTAPWALELPRR